MFYAILKPTNPNDPLSEKKIFIDVSLSSSDKVIFQNEKLSVILSFVSGVSKLAIANKTAVPLVDFSGQVLHGI